MRQIVAILLVPLLLVTQGVMPALAHDGPCEHDQTGRHHAAHFHVKSLWGHKVAKPSGCDCCPSEATEDQSSDDNNLPSDGHDDDAVYVDGGIATFALRANSQKVVAAAALALDLTPLLPIENASDGQHRYSCRLICEVHSCPTYLRILALLI